MPDFTLLESQNNGSSVLRRDGDRQVVVAGGLNTEEARNMIGRLNRRPFLRVGDAFEWIAAASFVAAGYIEFNSIPLALAIFGVCLVYFAQCLATAEIPRPRFPRLPKVKLPRLHLIKLITQWDRRKENDASPRPRH